MIAAFNEWLHIPEEKVSGHKMNHLEQIHFFLIFLSLLQLTLIKKIVEELHTASLLIDDIEDNSKLRRGVPVAHTIFGVPATINCANYVYFVAMQRGLDLGDSRVVRIFVEELIALHEGQGLDIFWRDHNICPSEEQVHMAIGIGEYHENGKEISCLN